MANESILDLLRLLLWEGNTEFYSDCESANISVEQAFRDSIYMGTDGLPVLLVKIKYPDVWDDTEIWDDTNIWKG